jgi:hypothetical protein
MATITITFELSGEVEEYASLHIKHLNINGNNTTLLDRVSDAVMAVIVDLARQGKETESLDLSRKFLVADIETKDSIRTILGITKVESEEEGKDPEA